MKFYLFRKIATMSRGRLELPSTGLEVRCLIQLGHRDKCAINTHGYTYTSEHKLQTKIINHYSTSNVIKKEGPSYHHPKIAKPNCGDRT